MSVESSLFSLANAERYVFRPLFIFVTFLLILLAAVQATGRLTMQVLHIFEPQLQLVAGRFNADLYGIKGDWSGFNPIVHVARLELPAGHVNGLRVELDVLESLARNTLVLHHASADDVRLAIEQTEQGWQLRGMPAGERQLDVSDLLEYSDVLDVSATLEIHAAAVSTFQVHAQLLNYGGKHFAELRFANLAHETEPFMVRAWRQDALLGVREPSRGVELAGTLHAPAALPSLAGATLRVAEGYWSEVGRQGGGELNLEVRDVAVPDVPEKLALDLRMRGERRADAILAVGSELGVSAGGETLELGPLYVRGHVEDDVTPLDVATDLLEIEPPQPLVRVWLEALDLAAVSGFFDRHLGTWEPAGRWVRALALSGTLNNVHAFFDDELGTGYMASFADLAMQGYKGAPTIAGAQGQLWGAGASLAAQVNANDVALQFPDLFTTLWQMDNVQGVVKGWFGPGYFALRGSHLKARMDDTSIAGAFAVSRPNERYEQRVSLTLNVDAVDLETAKTFVPYKIPDELAEWLDYGPLAGDLSAASFAYHGQVHTRPGELGRRIELVSDISAGRVRYEPTWPIVGDIEGSVHVAGVDTRIQVSRAQSRAIRFDRGSVTLHNNGDYVAATLESTTDFATLLDFVRNSPLQEDMTFVDPEWQGDGALDLSGELLIPIRRDRSPELAVDLAFDAGGVRLDMPNYRVRVEDLQGRGTFSLPHLMSGEFTASMFGHPAQVTVAHEPQWLRFAMTGTATPADAYALIDFDGSVPVAGEFNFDGTLSLAMADEDGVSNLAVTSDLVGLTIDLPAQFAKEASAPSLSELDVQFLADYQSVRFAHNGVQGWMHYGDEIERGALGVGAAPPMTAQDDQPILIGGSMPRVVLSDWVSDDGESAVALPLDWRIQNLKVDQFVIDELSFDEMRLSGSQSGEDVAFEFDAPTLAGRVSIPSAGLMEIDLDYIWLPDTNDDFVEDPGAPQVDPLSVEVGESLPAARVNVAQLDIGDEPFGSWRFVMRPEGDRIAISEFEAHVNGVHIEDAALAWDLTRDVSSFNGIVELDDLAETLPKWDYAASLATKQASVDAEISWPGSPVNISLLDTTGGVNFVAREGRFIEADAGGGVRILSLLNFSKIANRINFDFSDVVGEGISFEKIEAAVALDSGQLNFPEPMIVDSSAGSFQVGGKVNLHSGELNNEMIVTLPVSKSLPWYGVYLALANPLAGLGVIVGERVLRKPIEQFSTAKYAVRGTLDDPEVSFVSLWDTSMNEPLEVPPTTEGPAASVDKGNAELAGEPGFVDPSR